MAEVYQAGLPHPVDFYKGTLASDESPFRMWLFLGQSNMVGSNTGRLALPGQIDAPLPNQYTLDQDSQIIPARLPFPFDIPELEGGIFTGGLSNVSPSVSFSKALATSDPYAKILTVHVAVPGASFTEPTLNGRNWASPNSAGGYKLADNLYDRTVARANAAIDQGAVLEGILWCQGENDVDDLTEIPYSNELSALMADLKANIKDDRLGGHLAKPVIVLAMPPSLTGTGQTNVFPAGPLPAASEADFTEIERGKYLYSILTPFTAYVSGDGLTDVGDNIHYDAPSARLLGKRAFSAIEKAKRNFVTEIKPLTSLPDFRLTTAAGYEGKIEVSDRVGASAWKGAGLSTKASGDLHTLLSGQGEGSLIDMPIPRDGVHGISIDAGTLASAGFSASVVSTTGFPEVHLYADSVFLGSTRLKITREDAEIVGGGLVLASPNGTRWRISVDNSGNLTTTSL